MGQDRKVDGFMDNERLYSMIENLNQKVNELIVDVRQNNHIKDEVAELKNKVNENTQCLNNITGQREGKDNLLTTLKDWGGWVAAIIMVILRLLELGVI